MARHVVQQAQEEADGRRIAPAALRNAAPLTEALRAGLPASGRVLEIASGTGQHAAAFPALLWTPSDVDAGQRDSIRAWRREAGLENLAPPLAIDVAAPWPAERAGFDAVLTINLLHLIPAPFVARLFGEARAALRAEGRIIVYGPFLRGADFASDGDRDFDAALRERDPAIGYKSVEAVAEAAGQAGFRHAATDAMPANNLLLTFVAG